MCVNQGSDSGGFYPDPDVNPAQLLPNKIDLFLFSFDIRFSIIAIKIPYFHFGQ